MKKLIALLLSVLALGCDDETIRENFVPYFLCSYLPMWMGDCQDQAVIDKATSILDHGFTEAHADCDSGYVCMPNPGGTAPCAYPAWNTHLRASKLIDGGLIQAFPDSVPFSRDGTSFTPRGVDAVQTLGSFSCGTLIQSTIEDGVWILDVVQSVPGQCPDPTLYTGVVLALDIATECSGFNLGAF